MSQTRIPLADAQAFIGAFKVVVNDIVKAQLGDGMAGEIGERVEQALLGIAADELLTRLEAAGYVITTP